MRPEEKAEIVEEIRREFAEHFTGEEPSMACLYWSAYTARVLVRRGLRAVLQAGSLSWPCHSPDEDDGVSPTHFSYEWDPTSETTRRCIAEDRMPELHVWVALPDAGEIVDLTTCYLQEQAARLDVVWTAAQPPPFLWTTFDRLDASGIFYRPEVNAILWALSRIAQPPKRRRPCSECPFSRTIEPGFLGGSKPETYIGQAIGPFLLACHKAPDYEAKKRDPSVLQCAGAAIYRANIGADARLPANLLRCAPDRKTVFASHAEFLAHHHRKPVVQAERWLAGVSPEDLLRHELRRAGVEFLPVVRERG